MVIEDAEAREIACELVTKAVREVLGSDPGAELVKLFSRGLGFDDAEYVAHLIDTSLVTVTLDWFGGRDA